MDLKISIMAFKRCKKCSNQVKWWEITMEFSLIYSLPSYSSKYDCSILLSGHRIQPNTAAIICIIVYKSNAIFWCIDGYEAMLYKLVQPSWMWYLKQQRSLNFSVSIEFYFKQSSSLSLLKQNVPSIARFWETH